MKHVCIWLVKFYRKCLSPLKGQPSCRFVPCCSLYAIEAFEKRGFFVGLALTVWRILRCNPFCAGGYDPVPEKGFRYRGSREIPVDKEDCCHGGDPCREDDGTGLEQDASSNENASCKEQDGSNPSKG